MYLYIFIYIPWKSKGHEFNGPSEKAIILVGISNQQFQGTIFLMVFDLQGIYIPYAPWDWNIYLYE